MFNCFQNAFKQIHVFPRFFNAHVSWLWLEHWRPLLTFAWPSHWKHCKTRWFLTDFKTYSKNTAFFSFFLMHALLGHESRNGWRVVNEWHVSSRWHVMSEWPREFFLPSGFLTQHSPRHNSLLGSLCLPSADEWMACDAWMACDRWLMCDEWMACDEWMTCDEWMKCDIDMI